MGEVRNGDQKVRKYLFSEIFYGRQAVFNEDLFKNYLDWRGQKISLKISSGAQSEVSNRLVRSKSFFQKNIPGFICSVCVPILGTHVANRLTQKSL